MTTLSFTKDAARRLAETYATPDMVAQRATVLSLLDLRAGEQIIDLGCGPGYLSEAMAARTGPAGAVLGIDISSDLIALGQSRQPPGQLRYAQADALDIPQPHASFDVAACTQVAEYIPDTDRLLSEVFRVLRPGGRALIMATDWDCVAWQTDDPDRMERIMQVWAGHCAHPRLPRTLGPALSAAGFAVESVTMHPLINLDFREDCYSHGGAKLIRDYIERAGVDRTLAKAWFDDLARLSDEGRYYFASARMIFVARKPY